MRSSDPVSGAGRRSAKVPRVTPATAAPTAGDPLRAAPADRADVPDAAEPVAVVGLGCRLPQAPDPQAFWRLLEDGVDAVTPPPPGREAAAGGRLGGYLDRVDGFDAGFFRVTPREATAMDPRQRLVLELVWEAFEDAGIVPATVRGTRTAVFAGAMWDDYAAAAVRPGGTAIGRHTMTGVHRGMIANRVSYFLGLRGPSLVVDTGQSSSLVAVHLACESLRSGESSMAVVTGVNLALLPESTRASSAFGGLSPTQRCHTFDARADGYVRGEGGAALLLKPYRQAVADGDRVYCVIRGSAVTSDGDTDGVTVPSADAQQEAIRLACERAAVAPRHVQYVELHGTGTKVGDPIEAAALGAALGGGHRTGGAALRVGSVKTNIGHLEGAAGIVGLLKTVLSISHRKLPPSLNFETPNPRIPLAELRLDVQRALTDWPDAGRALTAGVSSFGMGGTNCHVVVGEPDAADGGGAPAAAAAVRTA
ncbi:MAG: polyketide synthase, partial [Streptomyces sp.]|nr:polyketide synthase [Streptomyces sp.]